MSGCPDCPTCCSDHYLEQKEELLKWVRRNFGLMESDDWDNSIGILLDLLEKKYPKNYD